MFFGSPLPYKTPGKRPELRTFLLPVDLVNSRSLAAKEIAFMLIYTKRKASRSSRLASGGTCSFESKQ